MLIGVIEAEQAERDQHADYARIDDAIRLAEQNIAALESRQLEPHETRKKWLAIRDRTILAIREARGNMIKRANEAKETRSRMIETFFRDVPSPGWILVRPAGRSNKGTSGLSQLFDSGR